ncbi:MAG: class I SAM-dependent methyltransferase [Patescibacteria group bacterium]
MSTEFENFVLIIEILILTAIAVPTVIALFTGAPWVPTPMSRVKKMLELANIKPGDRIYDLGCGDGRIVHLAAKDFKADAIGIELSPLVYAMAKVRAFILGSKSKIIFGDFRGINYSNAKAIVFYLLPKILRNMRPKFERELAPGTCVISYAFEVEGWEPTHIEPVSDGVTSGRIFVYKMPTSIKEKGNEAKK